MADRFDLAALAAPVMLGVQLDQTRVHQQAAYDPVGQRVYVTQVIANGVTLPGESGPPPTGTRDSRGDLAINQLDLDGRLLGVMYVRAFDHGSGIGAETVDGTPYVWLAYDAEMQPIGTNAHGRRIARLPFQPGKVVDVGDPSIDDFNPIRNATAITPCLDAANGRFAIAYSSGSGTRYRVFALSDWRAKRFDQPLYEFARPSYPDFQGWCLGGDFVYQFHGTGYSDTNLPGSGGNAWFTTIDIRTGATVARVHDEHFLDLPYREPESIGGWAGGGAAPRLVFGYATSNTAPRLMNLYAITAVIPEDLEITAQVVAAPQPGVQVTTAVADTASVQAWTIYRTVGGMDQVLVAGQGATLPATGSWFDPAPPACVPITYRLVVERTTGATDEEAAAPVTYVPEGGCSASGPVGQQDTELGCAASYTAMVHWRGGAQPFVSLDSLTAVSWARTINDISEASVTIATADVSADCCGQLGDVSPWVHELTIYRDGELVWQGPIQRIVMRRGSIVIEASDVFSWFDHLVNTYRVTYTSLTADDQGRRRGPITYIAENHIRLNLNAWTLADPDYPGVLPYIVRSDVGLLPIKVEKDGSDNTTIWAEYLGDILREWTKRGLTWTTVGRSLILRGRRSLTGARATARLTLDHFAGDVEVIKDGTQGATYGWATSQQGQNITDGRTLGTGKTRTPYGRLDILVRIQEEQVTAGDLLEAARDAIAGRYPVPTVINVPDSAQLTPDAPVTVRQLVPGVRIDLLADELCAPIAQGFLLSDVEVSWSQGGEKVGIALIPLADVDEELSG
ncbi:phage baseplate protein [Streptomyces sp. NPDC001142]